MKVKNISYRPHHIGDVTIVPGETAEIGDEWAAAINSVELVEAKEARKPGRPAKADKADDKADEGDGE